MTLMKEAVFYSHRSLETAGTARRATLSRETKGRRENMSKSIYCGFCGKERAKQGDVAEGG